MKTLNIITTCKVMVNLFKINLAAITLQIKLLRDEGTVGLRWIKPVLH